MPTVLVDETNALTPDLVVLTGDIVDGTVAQFKHVAAPLAKLIEWNADWVARDMKTINKPTKYEVRDGTY